MSVQSPSTTTFLSRGRLRGVLREQPKQPVDASRPASSPVKPQAVEQKAFDEALYYRARLILGESLPRSAG